MATSPSVRSHHFSHHSGWPDHSLQGAPSHNSPLSPPESHKYKPNFEKHLSIPESPASSLMEDPKFQEYDERKLAEMEAMSTAQHDTQSPVGVEIYSESVDLKQEKDHSISPVQYLGKQHSESSSFDATKTLRWSKSHWLGW